jgi:hypothetical protein
MVDGLGVTGVEGVFRKACEVTMTLLRENKDSLMSVLDAFIHDPLVEWEDEKRKLEREPSRRNAVKASVDLRMLAKNALNPIEKKLKGIYATGRERQEKEISTGNLVQILIQEATDPSNLVSCANRYRVPVLILVPGQNVSRLGFMALVSITLKRCCIIITYCIHRLPISLVSNPLASLAFLVLSPSQSR